MLFQGLSQLIWTRFCRKDVQYFCQYHELFSEIVRSLRNNELSGEIPFVADHETTANPLFLFVNWNEDSDIFLGYLTTIGSTELFLLHWEGYHRRPNVYCSNPFETLPYCM